MRKQFLVDKRMQLTVVFSMVGSLLLMGAAFVLSMLFLTGADVGPASDETRLLGVVVAGAFFLSAFVATMVTGIIATHRIAGPAFVLERAVRSLRAGEFDCRIHVRKRDHLKPLVAELAALRDDLQSQVERRSELRERIDAASSRGDVAAIRLLIEELASTELGVPPVALPPTALRAS